MLMCDLLKMFAVGICWSWSVSLDQVIWRLKRDQYQGLARYEKVSRVADFLNWRLKLEFYPKGYKHDNAELATMKPRFIAYAVSMEEVLATMSFSSKVGGRSPLSVDGALLDNPAAIDAENVELAVELHEVDGYRLQEVLNVAKSKFEKENTARKDAEAMAKSLAVELDSEKKCRQESSAEANGLGEEVKRLQAMISDTTTQASERASRATRAVVTIQSKWRQVFTQRQIQRERAERDRRVKRMKFVEAIRCLQRLWRLKKKRCERRWLREQKVCSEAETQYDAILVHMPLLQWRFLSFDFVEGLRCWPAFFFQRP